MHVTPTRAAWEALRAEAETGPIRMLNLIRYREGGAEIYAEYGNAAGPVFARVGGRLLWSGRPEQVVIGPAEERWDLAFVAGYPTLAAFLEMLDDPAYRAASALRERALADSRLIRMTPLE